LGFVVDDGRTVAVRDRYRYDAAAVPMVPAIRRRRHRIRFLI